jgi:hypothetical protein
VEKVERLVHQTQLLRRMLWNHRHDRLKAVEASPPPVWAGTASGSAIGLIIGAAAGHVLDVASTLVQVRGEQRQIHAAARHVLGRSPTEDERADFGKEIHAEKKATGSSNLLGTTSRKSQRRCSEEDRNE